MTHSHPFVDALRRELAARQGEAIALHHRYINPAYIDFLTMAGYGRTFVRAEGMELEDASGSSYLDFLSGYGVLNLGHNHPAVRAALSAVLDDRAPGFVQVDVGLLEGLAAERLVAALPQGLDKVYFCNSGAEAVEASMKLARAATGKRRLLACEGAYHGLTLGALSLHGSASMRDPFEPLLPGIERIPYDDLGALERALRAKDVAALVIEPILGEGGAVVPRDTYLPTAIELCHKKGALLIADEVQTGLGRTGRFLCSEHVGVTPDIVALSKSLGGGLMPVGAMVARGEVFARGYGSARTCLLHNTTFGGGPLAMAAVLATLDTLERERLVANAAVRGGELMRKLRGLASKHDCVREVRGQGLMLGLRFRDVAGGFLDRTLLRALGDASATLYAQYVAIRLIAEHRIVVQSAVNDPTVLKVMPPLIVDDAAIDRFVRALDDVLGTGHAGAMAHLTKETLRHRGDPR